MGAASRAMAIHSWQTASVRAGRALIGLLFVISGLLKVGRFGAVVSALEAKGFSWPDISLWFVIAVEVGGGTALILQRTPRAAAAVLAVFVVAATLLFHAFWQADASAFQNQLNHFLKNVAIFGALLALAFAPDASRRPGA